MLSRVLYAPPDPWHFVVAGVLTVLARIFLPAEVAASPYGPRYYPIAAVALIAFIWERWLDRWLYRLTGNTGFDWPGEPLHVEDIRDWIVAALMVQALWP